MALQTDGVIFLQLTSVCSKCLCHLLYFFVVLTVVNTGVKYTLEQWIFQYYSYMKSKSCNRRFQHKYPGVHVSDSLMMIRLVIKVLSAVSVSDKKNTLDRILYWGSSWWNWSQAGTFHIANPWHAKVVCRFQEQQYGKWLECYAYGSVK
jgi:hypothetical protein